LGKNKNLMSRSLVYNRLKELGFFPQTSIDCGACQGEWSSLIRNIYPETYIVGVDANDWNGNGSFPHADISEIQVLSDKNDEEVIFYKKIEGHCTGDSIFKENTFHYDSQRLVEQKRITKTLKYICNKNHIVKIDLLKLDTQGSEIVIMNGLEEMLYNIDFIEIECSLVEWNIGGCMIHDVIDYMKNRFEIFDIIEFHRLSNNDLIQIDILFKNKNSKINKPL